LSSCLGSMLENSSSGGPNLRAVDKNDSFWVLFDVSVPPETDCGQTCG
jgi:hypothetical protein